MADVNQELLKAIDIAIEAELKANKFYKESAEKVSNERGKNLLLQLANFELSHYNKLNDLKKSYSEDGKFIAYQGTEFETVETDAKSEVAGTIESNRDDALQILTMAIDAEKKAFEHYKRMADATNDPEGKEMFQKLADEETLHRRILSDEFYQLSNQGGYWSWGD